VSDERLIQEVLARYARAVDARDGEAVAELYEPKGRERLSYNRCGSPEPIAEFEGSEAIRNAVATILPAHPHSAGRITRPLIRSSSSTAIRRTSMHSLLSIACKVTSVQPPAGLGEQRGAKGESSPSRPATTASSCVEPRMVGRSLTTTRFLTFRPPSPNFRTASQW
jgi:hypothetical protein